MFLFNSKIFPYHPYKIYKKQIKWFPSDKEETYVEYNNLYKKDDITYKFNNNGFRCDEFNLESDLRIVFLGCSITEGIGVNQNEIWANIFLEKLKSKFNTFIPYWNLSLAGCGLDALLRAYYNYFILLQPHYVIAYFPCYRKEIYDQRTKEIVSLNIHEPQHFISESLDENIISYETSKNFLFLQLLLEKYNTKLFWNTWEDLKFYPNKINKFNSSIDWDQKARDKMHPGPFAHKKFAEDVWKEISPNIEI